VLTPEKRVYPVAQSSKNGVWMLLLVVAATLEVGGDALVRTGLHSSALAARLGFLACGALVLFSYGVVVNLPPWDFGRLLGVYVALFFLVAQVINWAGFGVPPTPPILVGGVLIISGAMVVTFWQGK
jgi:drug/metabolite transporter superfamily protein YnfA